MSVRIDSLTREMALLASFPASHDVPLTNWNAILRYTDSDSGLLDTITDVIEKVGVGLAKRDVRFQEYPMWAMSAIVRMSGLMAQRMNDDTDGASIDIEIESAWTRLGVIAEQEQETRGIDGLYRNLMDHLSKLEKDRIAVYEMFMDLNLLLTLGNGPLRTVPARVADLTVWIVMNPNDPNTVSAISMLHDEIRVDLDTTLRGGAIDRVAHYNALTLPYSYTGR